jgi:hypothetical protein
MSDPARTYLPTDPDVIRAAEKSGHTPEYVADAMNGPFAVKARAAMLTAMDPDEVTKRLEPALDKVIEAVVEVLHLGYTLGYEHGVTGVGRLMETIIAERTPPVPSDVRPHVPHVDPHDDPRLHLITDGVTACGVSATAPGRKGTHAVGEQDCSDCTAALRQAAFTPVQQRVDVGRNEVTREDLVARAAEAALAGDLGPAEELARTMHPGAFEDDDPPAPYRPIDLRSGEDVPAALARQGRGPVDDGRLGPLISPRGWDKIEGDPDAVEHLDPTAIIIGRSLAGELIDMTAAVVRYADEHKLRRWQCRYCGRGRVMGAYQDVTVHEEGDDSLDHEAHCEHNPDRAPGTVTTDA